ncbi:MAG TPA: serine/threonine-protein kinase, partial [Polyangiaceae bacterium]|nr:serine/threonine-protein kinase [Polyangiaceae bacterium]
MPPPKPSGTRRTVSKNPVHPHLGGEGPVSGPAPSTSALREGSIVGGKYEVLGLLGDGGMGFVVAARHLELGEVVALKFLRPEALKNPELVARFAREARASAKIKSEYVARVFDVGTLPDGAPFIVMEHLEGEDLSAVLETRGALPVKVAVEYVMQVCEALAAAHALGIVHRDIKPENLFLARRSQGIDVVKVLDFGISKLALTGSAF